MKTTALNARIPVGLKKAVDKYCEARGLKVQSFIEDLIQERLEDEHDLGIVDSRRDEKSLALSEVVANLGLGETHRS